MKTRLISVFYCIYIAAAETSTEMCFETEIENRYEIYIRNRIQILLDRLVALMKTFFSQISYIATNL